MLLSNIRIGLILSTLLSFQIASAQQNPFEIQGRKSADSTQNVIDSLTLISDTVMTVNIPVDSNLLSPRDTTLLSSSTSDSAGVRDPVTVISRSDSTNIHGQSSGHEVVPGQSEGDTSSLVDELKVMTEKLPDLEIGSNQNLLFLLTIVTLLLLAILLTLNRSMINKAYRAIANDNFLRFLFREYKSTPWFYWLFYIYFFISAGFFFYLLASYYQWLNTNRIWMLLLTIFGIGLVYIIKHFILQIVGSSFPVEKETQLYGFVTMLINILLGLALTPINLVIAFAPLPFVSWAIWLGLAGILGLYLFRQLKGLFIAGRFMHSYRFHFFLYLCTAEIAPLLILGKLAFGEIGT